MNLFAQALLFSYHYRKQTVWFFLFASLIGFSRVYVGVHYPFDVVAGAIFGVISGGVIIGLAKQVPKLYYYVKRKYVSH